MASSSNGPGDQELGTLSPAGSSVKRRPGAVLFLNLELAGLT